MPSLATVIPRFRSADRQTRLETLLDYARRLPPLPDLSIVGSAAHRDLAFALLAAGGA